MPRKARIVSQTNVYHIMLRGINQQIIFEEEEDFQYFVMILSKYKEICEYKIYTYCLMNNHIHILLEEGTEPLAKIFKRICDKYVYWYNHKYDRIGPLFQDRFRSEPVETEEYFLSVVRYILQNPVKAGIVSSVKQYKWCNYAAFERKKDFTDTEKILSFFSGREQFLSFINADTSEKCIDITPTNYTFISDETGKKIIQKVSGCANASEFQKLERNVRNSYIKELRKSGLSIRQISRLTGISKSVVGSVSAGQRSVPCPVLS